MSIEKVKAYFRSVGMEDRVLEFSVSSATVELAAQAVGCEPGRALCHRPAEKAHEKEGVI